MIVQLSLLSQSTTDEDLRVQASLNLCTIERSRSDWQRRARGLARDRQPGQGGHVRYRGGGRFPAR